MRSRVYAVLVALCLSCTAMSEIVMAGLNEGDVAYKRGDYVEALREFKQLATQGDAEAQYRLGFMYAAGQGMQQDPKEAVKW